MARVLLTVLIGLSIVLLLGLEKDDRPSKYLRAV